MIPVEIVDINGADMTILHRGSVTQENFEKFKLVKCPDGIVRISDMLHKNAIPDFVEALIHED